MPDNSRGTQLALGDSRRTADRKTIHIIFRDKQSTCPPISLLILNTGSAPWCSRPPISDLAVGGSNQNGAKAVGIRSISCNPLVRTKHPQRLFAQGRNQRPLGRAALASHRSLGSPGHDARVMAAFRCCSDSRCRTRSISFFYCGAADSRPIPSAIGEMPLRLAFIKNFMDRAANRGSTERAHHKSITHLGLKPDKIVVDANGKVTVHGWK